MNLFENGKINNEIDSYILGFLYADGTITQKVKNKYYQLCINLSQKDLEFIFLLKSIVGGSIYQYNIKNKKTSKQYSVARLCVSDVILVQKLIKLGITPNKTFNFGNPYDHIPKHLENHFIRGIFDGDGTINVDKFGKHRSGFVGTDKKLFDYIQNKLEEFLKKKIRRSVENGKYQRILFSGNPSCLNLYKFLYENSTFYMQRKRNKFLKIGITKGKNDTVGVSYQPSRRGRKKWMAEVTLNKKRYYGGLFLTKEEACDKVKEILKIYEK